MTSAGTAEISVANGFDGHAIVTLFHTSDPAGSECAPRDLQVDLPAPSPPANRPAVDRADRPFPRSGNVGAVSVVRKIEAELATRFPSAQTVAAPQPVATFADAEAHAAHVLAKVRRAKQRIAL